MTRRYISISGSFALLFGSLAINHSAFADPVNTLDSVVVTGTDFAIRSSNGNFDQQFADANAKLIDCEATASRTVCIDSGDNIVDLADYGNPLFSCTDIGFAAPKGNKATQGNCTAIALSIDAVYVGGLRNNNGSAVVKVADFTFDDVDNDNDGQTDEPGECPAGYTQVAATNFCSGLLVQDRPPISDMDYTPAGELLVLENKNTLNVYTEGTEGGGLEPGATNVVEFADNKVLQLAKGNPKEVAQHVSLFAYQDVLGQVQVTVVVTTSFGRLIVLGSDGSVVSDQSLLNLVSGLDDVMGCSLSESSYDATQNAAEGGALYAAVSDTCYVHTLVPAAGFPGSGGFELMSSVGAVVDNTAYNPLTVNAYAGVSVNFASDECGQELPPGQTANTGCNVGNVVTIGSFKLVPGSAETGTMWEITGMPHCAWNPEACARLLDGINDQSDLCIAGVLRAVGPLDPPLTCATAPPELLVYNATQLLPKEVTQEFPDGLPDLLFPPEYQAQLVGSFGADGIDNDGDGDIDEEDESYFFDALFFKADGVQAVGSPEFEVNIENVVGTELGCPEGDSVESLLNSDVVLRVSETFKAPDNKYQGSMSTTDCFNPSRSKGCCSLFPINWRITRWPATFNGSTWNIDSQTCAGCTADDTAPAKLYDKLYEELEANRAQLLCQNADGDPNSLPPIDNQTCTALENNWNNGKAKMIHAFSNTLDGTNCSGASRNYQAIASQLNNYQALLESYEGNVATCADGDDNDGDELTDLDDPDCDDTQGPLAQDPANRLGLQIGKTFTLQYVLNRLLLPSIPSACPDGWHEDDVTWIFD